MVTTPTLIEPPTGVTGVSGIARAPGNWIHFSRCRDRLRAGDAGVLDREVQDAGRSRVADERHLVARHEIGPRRNAACVRAAHHVGRTNDYRSADGDEPLSL